MNFSDFINMSTSEIITVFLINISTTAVLYLLVPLIFILRGKTLTKSKIKKIVIINGVCIWIIFRLLNSNGGSSNGVFQLFLWSEVGYFMLKRFLLKKETSQSKITSTSKSKTNNTKHSLSWANENSEKDSIYAIQKPSTQQNVSTLKILRKTTTSVGEITLEELQRERAEIEQRFGELKKVKDLLTPDAYYEAIDALSKEYDEVIAKIKLKL